MLIDGGLFRLLFVFWFVFVGNFRWNMRKNIHSFLTKDKSDALKCIFIIAVNYEDFQTREIAEKLKKYKVKICTNKILNLEIVVFSNSNSVVIVFSKMM